MSAMAGRSGRKRCPHRFGASARLIRRGPVDEVGRHERFEAGSIAIADHFVVEPLDDSFGIVAVHACPQLFGNSFAPAEGGNE
jgi:hypothetical protein